MRDDAPTVSRQVLRALIAAIEGTSRADTLRAMGLTEADLDTSRPRLTTVEAWALCERALAVSGDPALGLHWGARLEECAFQPVSTLLVHTGTLRRGLQLLIEFERLFHDRQAYAVLEHGETMAIRVNPSGGSPAVERFTAEMVLAGMLKMVHACFARATPLVVRLAHAAPDHHEEYARVFACDVRFEQPHSELVFVRSLLDQPSLHCDQDMHAAMKSVAEQRLRRLERNLSSAVRVRELLLERAPARLTMESAARELGMSGRSLRRQLAAEGTSYRAIEYAVLEQVARRLLVERGLTIKETAHEMGFSDAATFHRAFKTWTGVTPSAALEV